MKGKDKMKVFNALMNRVHKQIYMTKEEAELAAERQHQYLIKKNLYGSTNLSDIDDRDEFDGYFGPVEFK